MSITIQDAVPGDALGIGEVLYQTWLATYPNHDFGITADDIEDRFKDRKDADGSKIRNKPENERLLTAKDGAKIVGMCRAIREPGRNILRAIYVLPEYQGRGIGTMLWNEAYNFFDPAKDTIIEVVSYNANAIYFYTELGFRDTGERFSREDFRMKSGNSMPEMKMILHASN